MTKLLQVLVFCVTIASCLALGKATVWIVGGLPASLYGMLYFCLALHFRWVKADTVGTLVDRSIVWMPIVFLPICVGVIEYKETLRMFGLTILVAGLLTMLLTIACVGWYVQFFNKR